MSAWPTSEIVFLVALTLKVFISIISYLAAMLKRSHFVVFNKSLARRLLSTDMPKGSSPTLGFMSSRSKVP